MDYRRAIQYSAAARRVSLETGVPTGFEPASLPSRIKRRQAFQPVDTDDF